MPERQLNRMTLFGRVTVRRWMLADFSFLIPRDFPERRFGPTSGLPDNPDRIGGVKADGIAAVRSRALPTQGYT